jgi:hypothetical protein
MKFPLFVEILSHYGDVKARHCLHQLPIRIGRGYDNDVILDDPHAAAQHAQIELNQLDELIISDLGSHNGISLGNQNADYFVLDAEQQYRLGRTWLRVRSQDYAVAPELIDSTNHRWEGWLPAAVGAALLVITGLLSTWLSDLNQSSLSKYLLDLVSLLGLALGWSGIWALFGRLFTGHARFGRHLFIVGCGAAALELWSHLSGISAYALSWETLARFNNHPLIYIGATIIYFQLLTSGAKHPTRLKLYLAALALFASGVTMTKDYQASNHLSKQLYMGEIYPPVVRLSSPKPLADFMAEVAELKAQLDQERKENSDKESDVNTKTQEKKKAKQEPEIEANE